MSPKQVKRTSDAAALLALLALHIMDPYQLEYTEDFAGPLDSDTLVKWHGLMQDVQAMNPGGTLVHTAVAAATFPQAPRFPQ